MRFATCFLSLAVLPVIVSAHHSFSIYDRSVVHELEGELVGVRWRNPHVMFTVRAEDDDGQLQDWEVESAAVYVVERSGVQESMLDGVEYVKIAGWRSRDNSTMQVTNILLPDGKEILLSAHVSERWSDDVAGGQLAGERVNRAELDLFRVWSIEDIGGYGRSVEESDIILTDSAKAILAASPELDVCDPQGMPAIMRNPLPIEFVDNGSTIELQMNTFGVVRTIHMSDIADEATIPLSKFGYSVGERTGDTLEVRTTRVGWPYYDDNRTPQSENVVITEEFTLVDDKTRLNYSVTATDTDSFIEPITTRWYWADIGEGDVEITRCE
ncbi:MAG: DUF6152 family protein [Candidatus Rariloculaceae bacterium]